MLNTAPCKDIKNQRWDVGILWNGQDVARDFHIPYPESLVQVPVLLPVPASC